MSSDLAIDATGLVKRFGDNVALGGIDLEVPRGAIYGLLGPNGAGKTTAVRIFTTLLRPDAGSALIDGIDVVADPNQVRTRIGLTGQYAAVDERLTGRENMQHVARLFHLPKREVRRPHQRTARSASISPTPPTASSRATRAACAAGSTSR